MLGTRPLVFTFAMLCFLVLVACNPPVETANPAVNAAVSSKWLLGTGAPSGSTGSDGDMYLDTAAAIAYVKHVGAWINVATLQGPAGSAGSGWLTGAGAPTGDLGNNGDLYLDTATTMVHKKAGGTWSTLFTLQGPAGAPGEQGSSSMAGSIWHSGAGTPASTLGADGDYYLDTRAAIVFMKISGTWTSLVVFQGPAGPQGAPGSNGSTWYTGTGVPGAGLGIEGDYYLDSLSGNVYVKSGGSWTFLVCLVGPVGPQGAAGAAGSAGAQGLQGASGADGTTWYTGTGIPDAVLGIDGDFYLDGTSACVYTKTGGAWQLTVSLQGPAGPAGATGSTGPQGPAGPGITWVNVTGTSQQAGANTGYLANNTAQVTITLPDSASLAIGGIVQVSGAGAGGWKIAQNDGQTIKAQETPQAGGFWTERGVKTDWYGVASSSDGSKLAAVAYGGQPWTSSDSGVSWTMRDTGNMRSWRAIASSADGSKLVAVVSSGNIYTSTNYGATAWTMHESSRGWTGVASSADGTKLVAVASGAQIYTSADSGGSWTAHESARTWSGVASSSDGTKLVAIANMGQIYTSTDSGGSWTAHESSRNWTAVASSADGTKLVAAVAGAQIYTSTDSGANWTARESARLWKSVASSSDGNNLVAAVSDGPVYLSFDSGMSWMPFGSSRSWQSVASSADGTMLAAAASGSQIQICNTAARTTTPGTGGCIVGRQNESITLQYMGGGLFLVLDMHGFLFFQ